MTQVFDVHYQGAGHKARNLPCQDYSLSECSGDGSLSMVVLCDGHGDPACFRSGVGSKLAAEAARDCAVDALEGKGAECLLKECLAGVSGVAPVKQGVRDELWSGSAMPLEKAEKLSRVELCMRKLFDSIYSHWTSAIVEHIKEHPFTDGERALLGGSAEVKAYGTTLMAYVQAPDFWFAFHIGDGRMLSLDENGAWTQFVPWDSDCFLNTTTSMCGNDAVERFRYAYDGTGKFPRAVICCSDGVEDCFGSYEFAPEGLHGFFTSVVKAVNEDGIESTVKNLDEFLPSISEKRSHDDVSLAVIVNG